MMSWSVSLSFANGEAIYRRIKNPIKTQPIYCAIGDLRRKIRPRVPLMDRIAKIMDVRFNGGRFIFSSAHHM